MLHLDSNELENRIVRREAKIQHKKELIDQIQKLKSEGNSFSDISKELGLAENVVRQYFRESAPIDEVTEESKDDEPVKNGKPTRGRYSFNTGETIAEYYD